MDKYRIDSHKLIYHPQRVSDLLDGRTVYPIYMEISLSSKCNHSCTFCAYDYFDGRNSFINKEVLARRLSEMGESGVKSVLFSGEGEPLLHRDISEIVHITKKSGMDVAIATNGVLLNDIIAGSLLSDLTWIKISINAGTAETYAKIHNTSKTDFNLVIENISNMVEGKKRNNAKCTIGMQMLLLPENYSEAEALAKIAKETGVDYLVIKPYSQHLFSKTKRYKDIKYTDYLPLQNSLERFSDENFNLIFRIDSMKRWDQSSRNYSHCLALPFWAHIDTGGNAWGCGAYVTDDRFYLGNILKDSFQDIWNSDKRAKITDWASKELDTESCRVNCRMDKVNEYLWDLKNPSDHVNFI